MTVAYFSTPNAQRLVADGIENGEETRLVRVSEHVSVSCEITAGITLLG